MRNGLGLLHKPVTAGHSRFLLFAFIVLAMPSYADPAIDILGQFCLRAFETVVMPKDEVQRFCACVQSEISPHLTGQQRSVVITAKSAIDQGRALREDQFVSSGVRDLVVAAQARCQASFYPPADPINIRSGAMQLTMRCDAETHAPESFVSFDKAALLSPAELRAIDKKMMDGKFESEMARVTSKIDALPTKAEYWEIDLSGRIVSPPNAHDLIKRLRTAKVYEVVVERGSQRHSATFQVAGRIPLRWTPCGGVGE